MALGGLTNCVLSLLLYSSLLLSGSAGVQAVTGLIWNDADLDIYCTSIAAPFVRRWLIGRELNQAFGGYSEVSYKKVTQSGFTIALHSN